MMLRDWDFVYSKITSLDGAPATPRADKAVLYGTSSVFYAPSGPILIFTPDPNQSRSLCFQVPFIDEEVTIIKYGEVWKFKSEDAKREYLVQRIIRE